MRHKALYYLITIFFVLLTYCPLRAEHNTTEAEMDSLAMKFYSWEKGNEDDSLLLQQIADCNILRALESYTQTHEYVISQNLNYQTYIKKVLIIVKENIYSAMPSYIIRYAHDIHNAFGSVVDIVSVNGETAPQIRSLIQSYATYLNGVVFVGNIAPAYYYHPDSIVGTDTLWREETFPCDLYYMDLNGDWSFKTGSSVIYSGHSGDVKPEIFVGRINTATMGRDEVQELKWYFDRNHYFWMGKKTLNKKRALTFTGLDWSGYSEFLNGIIPLYGVFNYNDVHGSLSYKSNYCTYLQNNDFEFIQLACHSSPFYHNFRLLSDSIMTYDEIYALGTKQIGYNLFCCKACKWTASASSQCLGESYLYGQNNNSSTLALVGSTKTGGMLGFSNFYTPLGDGKCIGQALKRWWIDYCGSTHTHTDAHWFYGMTILGDPLIDFNFTNDCDNILTLTGTESTNNMYYAQSMITVQNYSIPQGKSVTLSAPTIEITGSFSCDSGATFLATPYDYCLCNTREQRAVKGLMSSNVAAESRIKSPDIQLSVYPNPTKDLLTIEANELLLNVSLYDQHGQKVLQTTQTQIDISFLPPGIYVIYAITTSGNILQAKIIHL